MAPERKRQVAERIWLPVTMLLLATITVLSLFPLDKLPEVPGTDKTHHVIAYSTLMLPAFFVRSRYRYRLLLTFVIWGGVIEIIQPFVNRHASWMDLLANVAGLVIGCAVGHLTSKFGEGIVSKHRLKPK